MGDEGLERPRVRGREEEGVSEDGVAGEVKKIF